MDKRGESLSMNVVIIAAIALLVLVVIALIFTGRMGSWSRESRDCQKQGGTCTPFVTLNPYESCPTGLRYESSLKCFGTDNKEQTDRVCCRQEVS